MEYLDFADVNYLDDSNARFYLTENGFPAMEAVLPEIVDDLETQQDKTLKKQDFGRVYFHRCFPFDTPDEYISVLNKDGREYGIILDLNKLCENSQAIIRKELDRKYLCPTIKRIVSLKDKLDFSFWSVETDRGVLEFSTHDTYRNIAKAGGNILIITDVDGNRYRIDDYEQLDKKSYKKIELYI